MDTITSDIKNLPTIDDMGLTEQNFIQVNPSRSVAGNDFTKGVQDFSFNTNGTQYWSPQRSFFRMRLALNSLTGTTAPTLSERLALAENCVNNLYSNVYSYIGNVDVSSNTQFNGEVGMLRHRLSKSKQWLDTIGKRGYYLVPSLEERINDAASDGVSFIDPTAVKTGRLALGYGAGVTVAMTAASDTITFSAASSTVPTWKVGDVITLSRVSKDTGGTPTTAPDQQTYTVLTVPTTTTITVVPAISADLAAGVLDFQRIRSPSTVGRNQMEILFQPPIGLFSTDSAISGQVRLSLMPRSNLISAVQTETEKTIDTDFNVVVDSLYFFMSVFRSEKSFDSGTYYLSLDEINCQSKKLNDGSDSQNNMNFTVPSSTRGLAVFASGTASGSNTTIPPSYFENTLGTCKTLKHLQVSYGNEVKPLTNWDSEYTSAKQYLTQRYIDTHIHSGLYHVAPESFEDWIRRGIFSYFSWVKSKDNLSTEVQVSSSFSGITTDTQLFLASIYRNIIKVEVDSGYITSVSKLSI